ncbi:MAG: hypothetical protein AAFY66_04955 [Pseudomonadota bacterium]
MNAAALATLSEDTESARDGPEGAAELRRLAQAADALVKRPADPVTAAVFAGMLPDCTLADAAAAVVAEAMHEPQRVGRVQPVPRSETEAWQTFVRQLLAAPETLREELAFRLAAAFVETGASEALALIEPHAVSPDDAISHLPRRALIEAELAFARGDREAALDALRSLAGPQHSARQAAAILLAERLDPVTETPISAGWLAHLDLTGSIALEASGTPLAERAALAEVRLAEEVLGPADALRRLSLAHQRGLVSTDVLAAVAERIDGTEDAVEPVPLPILRAFDPRSFASLEALDRPPPDLRADTSASPTPRKSVPVPQSSAASGAPATRPMRDWRSLVSAAGAGDAPVPPSEERSRPGEANAGPAEAADNLESADATLTPPDALELSTAESPRDQSPRDDLLDDVERFLSITERDLTRIEELLDDG